MSETTIDQVVVDYTPQWGKWPDTGDTDFSSVTNPYRETRYRRNNRDLIIRSHYYPAYAGWAKAGVPRLPAGLQPPGRINNTLEPPPAVLDAMIEDLKTLSRTCQSIHWRHAWQCYPRIAAMLPSLFRSRILEFGDDCPGSSEIKTFPVAKYFNTLVHNMWVWDHSSGKLVKDKYAEHGLQDCRFVPLGPSSGTGAFIQRDSFDMADKARKIRDGEIKDSLIFIGTIGWVNPRRRIGSEIACHVADLEKDGFRVKLHGHGMRDGILEPLTTPEGPGVIFGPLYRDALFGYNVAISSLFNGRLFDLWLCGVVQVVFDPHRELPHFGFVPDRHYLEFDGTATGLFDVLRRWRGNRQGLADIAAAGNARCVEFLHQRSYMEVFGGVYHDHFPPEMNPE